MYTGKLIVLEGPDGSGKSTQAKLLAEALRASGKDVLGVREPGGTPMGEGIRKVLLDPKTGDVDPWAEVCLFTAARTQLVRDKIRPALQAGKIVVCDRFLLSTLVYQGYDKGSFDNIILDINKRATGGLSTDLTIILTVSLQRAFARMGCAPDRIEAQGRAYHERVHAGYAYAITCPKPLLLGQVLHIVTDQPGGNGGPDDRDIHEIHEEILAAVRNVVG